MKYWTQDASKLLRKTLTPPRHELNELDWKQAISPDKKRLAEHLSAFSNYPGGGFLIYGVTNTGKPESINETIIAETLNQLSNIGRNGLEPAICLDHSVEDFDGEKLLFVRIAENAAKPVHVRGDMRETFVRSGGTTRKATKPELAALMLHSKTLRWEELRATTLISDGDMAAKLDTMSIFAFLNRKDFTSQEELLRWLASEKFVSREPSGGGYLTNLGVMACAHTLAEFTDLARKAVRVVIYKGFDKSSAKEEAVGQKGYAIGFQGLVGYIVGRLPQSEVIEQALRVKRSVYPEIALREIIANAMIHQDFTVSGSSPMVEIYDDRIEISNPGNLLPNKKADRLIGAQPESRNQELAQAFMRYGICEQRGSGLIKAGQQAEFYGLPPIEFYEGPDYFKVTLYSPRTFSQMSAKERLNACYQHATLKHLAKDTMTNKSLRQRLKMPERQRSLVSVLIQEALEKKLIKKSDPESKSMKYAKYIPHWA